VVIWGYRFFDFAVRAARLPRPLSIRTHPRMMDFGVAIARFVYNSFPRFNPVPPSTESAAALRSCDSRSSATAWRRSRNGYATAWRNWRAAARRGSEVAAAGGARPRGAAAGEAAHFHARSRGGLDLLQGDDGGCITPPSRAGRAQRHPVNRIPPLSFSNCLVHHGSKPVPGPAKPLGLFTHAGRLTAAKRGTAWRSDASRRACIHRARHPGGV
jgi:hypothetical protein